MSNREEYVEQLKTQLDKWNAEVSKWEGKTKAMQASARAEYDRQLAAFRKQRDEALAELRKVQGASGEAWTELAHGADAAWASMRAAFEKAQSHFTKK
jgi:lipid II:glycine glycyltransferase (peptidoglycan interpeptide bridge formation enzyme)